MYAYRQMTREQQQAVVRERDARGFPWHKPSHPKAPEGWYFITAACYEHEHHFCAPNELTALQIRLFEAFAEVQSECGGWVVMPNHYHALLTVGWAKRSARFMGEARAMRTCATNRRGGGSGTNIATGRFAASGTFGPVCTTSSPIR